VVGALQVAGVNDCGLFDLQPLRHCLHLAQPGLIERDVHLAHEATVAVPFGLPVTHEQQSDQLSGISRPMSSPWFAQAAAKQPARNFDQSVDSPIISRSDQASASGQSVTSQAVNAAAATARRMGSVAPGDQQITTSRVNTDPQPPDANRNGF
jgi:hypothetical protein